jgi:hypothetical protein
VVLSSPQADNFKMTDIASDPPPTRTRIPGEETVVETLRCSQLPGIPPSLKQRAHNRA